MGSSNKDIPPKIIIIKVWDDHIIQPKARLGSSEILKSEKANTIASG